MSLSTSKLIYLWHEENRGVKSVWVLLTSWNLLNPHWKIIWLVFCSICHTEYFTINFHSNMVIWEFKYGVSVLHEWIETKIILLSIVTRWLYHMVWPNRYFTIIVKISSLLVNSLKRKLVKHKTCLIPW